MAGGKGGSQTVKVPKFVEEAGKKNLARADEIAQLGYVPYYGPDVAAFTPMQQAAFANTGAAAGAYGLSGGGMTGMEGMPTAVAMPGGGYGYSAAPIYEQSIQELQARAPAQYDFIRGMFIDPVTGERPLYPFGTEAAAVAAGGGAGGAGGGGGGGGYGGYGGYQGEGFGPDPLGAERAANPTRSAATFGSYMPGGVNSITGVGSRFDTAFANARNAISPTLTGGAIPQDSSVSRPVSREQGAEAAAGKGCVVATHAVASGAFTPSMKREAVVWCMDVLHGKWWGEAIRRGYRHLGRKKIEQGKAHEHYAEFRRYIAFANGKERTLRGALTFTLRTAQFFAVGMITKEV